MAKEQDWPVQRLDVVRISANPDDPPGIGFYGEEQAVIAWLRRQQEPVGVWCSNDLWAFDLAETCHHLPIAAPGRGRTGGSLSACISAFGCSPFQLIRRQRRRTAQQLLRDSDLPVGEVAARCGWSTMARSSSEFSTASGCAPSVWRQRARDGHSDRAGTSTVFSA
ncbi:MAG: helix-turn-helix domain-containing protein [Planctomycetota bacterium]